MVTGGGPGGMVDAGLTGDANPVLHLPADAPAKHEEQPHAQ